MNQKKYGTADDAEAQPLKIDETQEAAPPSLGRRISVFLAAAIVVAGSCYYVAPSAFGAAVRSTFAEEPEGGYKCAGANEWSCKNAPMSSCPECDQYDTAPAPAPAPAPGTEPDGGWICEGANTWSCKYAPISSCPKCKDGTAPAPGTEPDGGWKCAGANKWSCPYAPISSCPQCKDGKDDDPDEDDKSSDDKKKKSGGKGGKCFPAAATVELSDGATKSMASLQLGDEVLDATGAYSPVYFFSHADAVVEAPFVELVLEGDHKISLSPDHYIASNGKLLYAKDVSLGDKIDYVVDGATKSGAVVKTSEVVKRGLYNPYTLSGTLVVDGVAASCHSSWILDGLLPPRVAAVVYQRLFAVPRLAYKMLGPEGMDKVFSVGNTGATASISEQTVMLFGVCAFTIGAAAAVAKAALNAY